MPRPRDRQSATGLLPRMEARTRKDGQITYRFHPLQPDGTRGKPINLGTDKALAIRQVLDMAGCMAVNFWHEMRDCCQTIPT